MPLAILANKMLDDLTYELQQLPNDVALAELRPFFNDLPLDHYISGNFRRRRLSRFRGPADNLVHLPHATFMQSGYVNQLLGNIQREYDELDEALIASASFMAFIKAIQDFFGFDPDTSILGVHQIRINCSSTEFGEPAPEGIHQDGFDYITICCVDRHQVDGAKTEFFLDPQKPAIFSKILEPGEIAYCNDRNIYHYTTPIHPAGSESGFRDVFVVTIRCNVDIEDQA